jgi:hypothetical protein
VAEEHGEISKRHLELLRVTADLASNDPTAVVQMYTAAQRMNLNTVGKQADRTEFLAAGASPRRGGLRGGARDGPGGKLRVALRH